ncbi:DUF501 domain-containing protein [Rudaeicoccus suwonensis]|uniref:DUF501 domain-containing protein n=1 Tax=Rudaeicoccus suwonensis TaxID=657409 RepID=A0A561E891_9MICO|nr:DUF501 domain-containing protein [Rudaeicoccus suwonensis]TWE11833.1 hypothetical protein BKA23_0620 [Rudaeicoccus suwonensis]
MTHQPDSSVDPADIAAMEAQLGRLPRGVVDIAHRCPCGCPDVVRTLPRLPGGTPFPTTFYATCPKLTGAISTLEARGMMRQMTQDLADDPVLAAGYQAAHEDYLRRRADLGQVAEIDGISAGGMPDRVKCLHVLVAHSLAVGPGVNPLGDRALEALPQWWLGGCCSGAEGADAGDADTTDRNDAADHNGTTDQQV